MPEGPRVSTHHLLRRTIALVLAAGRGSRLGPLTEHQAKPALPFGGKFKVIDFALSNCLNSGIRRIGVITQYKSQTLVQHLHCTYVLEGSVRREGNLVRLTVQLIDARDDRQIWSESYDRTLGNAMALEREVADEHGRKASGAAVDYVAGPEIHLPAIERG